MKTQHIPADYQHTSPAGAEVRVLMNNEHGGMAHCTLKDKKVSKAVQHKTVVNFGMFCQERVPFGEKKTTKNR